MSKLNKSVVDTSLFTLSWPILVELILQMLIGSVDQFMIASYSDHAVAAIGNVNQILNVLIITFGVISLATTIMVSQALGSSQFDKISEIYSVAFFSNLSFSVVISGVLFSFSSQIFEAMQLPPDLMDYAMSYMSIVGGFIFLQACQSTFSAIFRSNGMMKQIMFVSITINIVNIMGNFILIHGIPDLIPAMGVTGVAISSVISRLVGCGVLWYMFNQFS
ncbi:MAG: MATE family efflux transporter, partial [Oscillospiraceae bacterium]